MKVLSFAGSLRAGSTNKKLAREAVRLLCAPLTQTRFVDLRDHPMPVYDGDAERSDGVPDSVSRLGTEISHADALIIATPEYNGSISSVLKNAVDWLSRIKPMPLKNKHLLLLGASPGGWGGIRGLWHSRVPFEALGVHVFPEMMSLPNAGSAFDENGHLQGERARQLQDLVVSFAGHARARIASQAAWSSRQLPTPDQPVFGINHLAHPRIAAAPQHFARCILDRQRVGDDGGDMGRCGMRQFANHGGRDPTTLAVRKREVRDLHLAEIVRLFLIGAKTDSTDPAFDALRRPEGAPTRGPDRFGHLAKDVTERRRKISRRRVLNSQVKPFGRGR